MSKISIIATFAGLWLTSYLSDTNQLIFGFILIFTFGILHGANDLVLINQIENKKKMAFLRIISFYIIIVLSSVVMFTLLPTLALLLFLLVSGYHFGEQHWVSLVEDTSKYRKPFELLYGLFILSILLYINEEEVTKIIYEITKIHVNTLYYKVFLIATGVLLVLFSYLMTKKHVDFKNNIIEQLFYLVLLCVIFKSSSLIWGFTIYFIFWHSIPSLNDQITFLYGKYSFHNFKQYFKTAFLYWLLSLIGITLLYYVAKDLVVFDALFFSFLASITFPHAFVILKMFKK
jgi:Brp/Blh family beta-carotene 15,15'-monooxygenase